MATYVKQARKKGTVWRAQVRKRQNGTVHSEARTFSTKALAKSWAEKREKELEDPQGARKAKDGNIRLEKLINDYTQELGDDAFGYTKRKTLEALSGCELAQNTLNNLTSEKVLDHVRQRRKVVAPSTAAIDLMYLKSVLTHARYAWGVQIDTRFLEEARATAHHARLIGKSKERDRRPTDDELSRLREWFNRPQTGQRPRTVPMADIIDFAVASARRRAEITRLRWKDLDQESGVCLLRDAKSPTGSKGNHREFALTKEALAIIDRQPRKSEYIFPYRAMTVGKFFHGACVMLGIEDLCFHDLRHEAASRLFEAGYQIHEVQQFTLHQSWTTLQRYTQLRPEDVALRP